MPGFSAEAEGGVGEKGRQWGDFSDSPIHLIREVKICRYLVFWTSKKVKGPRRRVKIAWGQKEQ